MMRRRVKLRSECSPLQRAKSDLRRRCSLVVLVFSILADCLIQPPPTGAQAGPSFELNWETFPSSDISFPIPFPHTAARLATFSWKFAYSWQLSEDKGWLTTQLRYKRRSFEYTNRNYQYGGTLPETLYSLDYQIDWQARLSERFSSRVFFNPVLENGSERTLKPADFKFSGGAVFRHRLGRGAIGLGAMWSRDFGEELLLPIVHLSWQDSNHPFWMQALLPTHAEVWYRLHRYGQLGVTAQIEGSQFRVDEEDVEEQVRYWVGNVGPELRIHPHPWIHLLFRGGTTFFRGFDVLDSQGKLHSRHLHNSGFVHMGVCFGIMSDFRFP